MYSVVTNPACRVAAFHPIEEIDSADGLSQLPEEIIRTILTI